MAGTLTFRNDKAFKAVVHNAVSRKTNVVLAKDRGVYLCSFTDEGEPNKVAYAEGLDPNIVDFDEWWDKAREICGGDDFAEPVDLPFLQRVADSSKSKLTIKLTSKSITMKA